MLTMREVDEGGFGAKVRDWNRTELLQHWREAWGERARWVTSVCTGSLLLGAAGLLNGYDATSHWATTDLLPIMGARHVDRRVVIDRNRATGGGVTAGIDFGLALAAQLRDEEAARRVQLILEYAPEPPFRNGTPAEAGPERTATLRAARQGMDAGAREAAIRAGRRLGTYPWISPGRPPPVPSGRRTTGMPRPGRSSSDRSPKRA